MAESFLKVKSAFTDGTTKDTTVGPFRSTEIGTYRQQISTQAAILNDPTQREELYSGFTNGFVSNAGAPFASIRGAEIITQQITVIY